MSTTAGLLWLIIAGRRLRRDRDGRCELGERKYCVGNGGFPLGHASSGVILSTVGYGADADCRLIVAERLRRPGNWGAPTFEA